MKEKLIIFTISLTLIALVNCIGPGPMGYETFKKLEPCESKCVQLFYEQKANPDKKNPLLIGCQAGCNYFVLNGVMDEGTCRDKCKSITKSNDETDACVKGCKNFVVDLPKIADEKPIVTEIKKIDDIKNLVDILPAIPINTVNKDDGSIKQPPKIVDDKKKTDKKESKEDITENESSSSSSEEEDEKKSNDKKSQNSEEIESPFEVFRHFFGSSLIGGEPGLQNQQQQQQQNTNNKKNDDLTDIDDKLFDQTPSTFETLFNYFDKIRESLKSAYDKGSYILRVRIFSNGTVVKTYSELPDAPPIDSVFEQPDSIFAVEPVDKPIGFGPLFDPRHHGRLSGGEGINWKGIPMPIGKPIIEPYQPNEESPFQRFRECRPISFHFSTFCHDINNLFTCASMRTGLPRWFFLSAVLLTSFLLIWLGLFILATLRRLRKRERIIHHGEEYLPLYKDIDFEIEKSEINPAFDEAGPLPVKVKIDNVV